jgi:hypothetical protein
MHFTEYGRRETNLPHKKIKNYVLKQMYYTGNDENALTIGIF